MHQNKHFQKRTAAIDPLSQCTLCGLVKTMTIMDDPLLAQSHEHQSTFAKLPLHDLRYRLSRRYVPLLLYTCLVSFGRFLLRCILAQTQTQLPDVIPCYFIVKCSVLVPHQINLSHVVWCTTAAPQWRRVLPAPDASRNNLVSHWSIIFYPADVMAAFRWREMRDIRTFNFRIWN